VRGEVGRAATAAAGGVNAAAGSGEGVKRSRLGLLPCKRHAEGQLEDDAQG
jgi:hypothetical protein